MNRDKLRYIARLLTEKVLEPVGWQIKDDSQIGEKNSELLMKVVSGKRILKIGIRYKQMLTGTKPPEFQDTADIAMLAAPHIPKTMMERLKTANVCAIDETGNYYFSYKRGKERLMLYEFGNEPPKKRPVRNQPFSPKAGFVTMALLCAKDFEVRTMRELQARTGVSLSGIFSICDTLRRHNLIEYSHSKPIRILDPCGFLDEWAAYYLRLLAPKTHRQGYQISKRTVVDKETGETKMIELHWREAATQLFEIFPDAALTGVQAAQSVSKFYSLDAGEVLVSSLKLAETELKSRFILTKTNRPNLILTEPYNGSAFMEMTDTPEQRTANSIQIYLDLLASDDPRANEFAEIYREKALGY